MVGHRPYQLFPVPHQLDDKKGGGAYRTAACLIAVHLLLQQLPGRALNPVQMHVEKHEGSMRALTDSYK